MTVPFTNGYKKFHVVFNLFQKRNPPYLPILRSLKVSELLAAKYALKDFLLE